MTVNVFLTKDSVRRPLLLAGIHVPFGMQGQYAAVCCFTRALQPVTSCALRVQAQLRHMLFSLMSQLIASCVSVLGLALPVICNTHHFTDSEARICSQTQTASTKPHSDKARQGNLYQQLSVLTWQPHLVSI